MSRQLATGLERVASSLERSHPFYRVTNIIGSGIFFLVICLTFIDVFLRYVFNRPLSGVCEVTTLSLVVIVSLGIAYAQVGKRHISIDLLVERLSPKGRVVINNLIYLLYLGIVSVLIWHSTLYALLAKEEKIIEEVVNIPIFFFVWVVVFGCVMLWLMILRDFLNNLVEGLRLHLGGPLWLLSFGILALLVAGMILLMQPTLWDMSRPTLGIIGLVAMFLLFSIGIPIGPALMIVSFVFMSHLYKQPAVSLFMGANPFMTVNNYLWTILAFFVVMGYLIFYSEIGRDLYNLFYKWFGHLFGGLAVATVGASTAMAAVVGASLPSTVVMGTVALPEMRKYKYSDRLSAGSICCGGTLGPLIPPSTGFILYGLLTEQSIGTLFIAGIIPGLLLASAFMIYIYIQCRHNPKMGPPGPSVRFSEKLAVLKFGGPIVVLFVLVIGGIYIGMFTPTEGGAIGTAGAFIIGLAMRRFNRQNFIRVLADSAQLTAMIFFIIIGAIMFGKFLVASHIPAIIRMGVTKLAMPPIAIMIIITVIYLILGCFMDTVAIKLITIPIFFPVIMALGYDPIWFGVIVVVTCNLGMITPPLGVVCFTLKGVAPDISIGTIFRGVVPFVCVTVVVLALIVAFPQIATWLPYLLKGYR